MKSKKSIRLSEAFPAVLTIVLIAILVIVAIVIFTSLSTSFPLSTASVINETGGFLNNTGYTLKNISSCNYQSPSIVAVTNVTDSVILTSGNYTLVGNVLKNATTTTFTNVLVSYNYQWGGNGCNAAATTITQFAAYPALIGLVGTIIFLALVIGVLVASFAFRRKGI